MRQTRYLILLTLAGAASGAAQVPVTAADSSRAAADSARRVIADTPRSPPVTPGADQARGVDAELRVALFDLLAGRELPALSRLQHLQASPVALTGAASGGALRGRQDVLFLLAQSYYRLGIDAGFRGIAEALLREPSAARYAPVLRAQLLVDAYRGGDYAGALELSRRLDGGDASGLTALVAGLAAYQSGNFAAARTALARARETGGAYAGYAAYMEALTTLRADTGQTAPALAALKALAGTATGELADQVRLTAAQLAYESGDYAEAASLAQSVSAESGLASQALLTRAWSLYKADQVEAAGSAFNDFATRFPLLPQRDESRLMAAQALLQLGRSAEAEQSFKLVADSSSLEISALQGAATASMEGAARSLVADRSVGLLMVADPSAGKTVTLDDATAYDASVLASVVSDTARPRIASAPPAVVSVMDVTRRNLDARPVETDSLRGPLGGAFPMRVLFMPASATSHPQAIAGQSRALFDADGAVALARFRLEELLEAQAREAALLEALQATITSESAAVESLAAQIQAARDSLAALDQMMSAAEARIRSLFSQQIAGTRELAEANVRAIDSLRTGFAGQLGPTELEVLDNEARTAATYLRIAQLADSGSTAAISRHPTFAMRDSARAHGERAGALLAELQASRANAQRAIAEAMSRLQQGQGPDAQTMRSALATAEAQRATIEAQLVTTVRSELLARAGEMVEELQRDAEAAQFGTASASFFQAIDAGRSPGTASPGTTPGSRNTEPAAAPATPPTQKK